MSSFYDAVYALVREIPPGRVMTYGQIATHLGCPRAARAVGYALRASKNEKELPWHRVINHKGAISIRSESMRPIEQQARLEAEGVCFNRHHACDLKLYRWTPPDTLNPASECLDALPFR